MRLISPALLTFLIFIDGWSPLSMTFFGFAGVALHQGGIGWPRVNASADFKKPIKFGDLIKVSVSIAEIRTRSIRYAFEFRVNESDEIHATGEMVSVCVDLATMKAIEIPPTIRCMLE